MKPYLSMRAWVEREGESGGDPYGHGGAWSDVLIEQPCFWWVTSGQEQINPQRAVTVGQEHIMLDRDADIRPGDRVRRLLDHERRVLWDSQDAAGLAREVEHVGVQLDHLDVTLRSTS